MNIEIINNLSYTDDFPRDVNELKKVKISKNIYLKVYCTDCGVLLKKTKITYIRDIDSNGNLYCRKCSSKYIDKNHKLQAQKETNLKKYGVENVFQSQEVKDKIKKHNLENYGVEYVQQSESFKQKVKDTIENKTQKEKNEIIEKRKKTNLSKYGVDVITKLQETKDKIKSTCIDKYGTNSFLATDSCKNALLKKYNVKDNISQSDYWKNKVKQTSIDKYGENWFTKADSVKNKAKQTCIIHFGVPYYAKSEKFREEQQSSIYFWQKEALQKRDLSSFFVKALYDDNNHIINLCCMKCGNTWELSKVGQYSKYFICEKCFPNGFYNGRSHYEDFICDILKKYNISFIKNDRKVLNGKEIDIYLPNYKIGIEIDGIYWHSLKDKYYHLSKTEEAINKDIRLIHFTDTIIDNNPILIENFIKNIISIERIKVYARQCNIKEINNNNYKCFCNNYHLQGYTPAKIRLGLFYNNELIQIMSFSKPRFNKNFQYELIREVSKSNYRIIGGKNKLLKYFEKNYNPQNLISYCDRRWFTGKSYIDCGFTLLGTTVPSYNYYKKNIILSRYQCQKHKLAKLLDNFDNNLSEYQNMINNGYYRVFDCGQFVFVKDYLNGKNN